MNERLWSKGQVVAWLSHSARIACAIRVDGLAAACGRIPAVWARQRQAAERDRTRELQAVEVASELWLRRLARTRRKL